MFFMSIAIKIEITIDKRCSKLHKLIKLLIDISFRKSHFIFILIETHIATINSELSN